MGVVYQHASSTLLCGEDNSCAVGSGGGAAEMGAVGEAPASEISGRIVWLRDLGMVFAVQGEEWLSDLMEKEREHLAEGDYAKRLMNGALDASARKDAVEWIQKAHAYYGFGSVSAYLSVNYVDRFLSAHELPKGKAWMMQLLAVACLSLAIKMEETEIPLSVDLQIANAKYVFEAKAIQRMELLVLSKLKWRMKAVTPFSFLEYFIRKFNNGKDPKEPEINRFVELILSTIRGIFFLEFRPSEVAAAAAISALSDAGSVLVEKYLNNVSIVDKVKVMECYEALQQIRYMEERPRPASSIPQSPIGVLDAVCLSCNNSDETISSSNKNSPNNSPASKKRKLNGTSAT